MKTISFEDICSLNIFPKQCVQWAGEIIMRKHECTLPPKNSIKYGNNCFFNTMPSYLPFMNRFGVKVVSRIPERIPALKADILLYDSVTGDLLSFMDGTWITTMRTGAIAAISINKLKKNGTNSLSFIGLGNTARATLLCYEAINVGMEIAVNLLKYKDQHNDFMKRFEKNTNIRFTVYESVEKLIEISDVIVSCVTSTDSVFADEKLFKKGVLVVPVHTRGFQNCDVFFDQIFCDDIAHISDFKYFNEYKSVTEMTDILVTPPPIYKQKGGYLMKKESLSITLVSQSKIFITPQKSMSLFQICMLVTKECLGKNSGYKDNNWSRMCWHPSFFTRSVA